ncbi:hypothetical protein ACQPYK_05065 [Streptosporangium sp. CA-135522]|uniref:hypothetical protein n=1 Tax=Streptosporangium sp. CA-135522 TaxID=3240072 RepID=UPI003D922A75
MPGPPRVFSDEQVWPPAPKPVSEPAGTSTQPFPAVPGTPPPGPLSASPAGPVAPASPLAVAEAAAAAAAGAAAGTGTGTGIRTGAPGAPEAGAPEQAAAASGPARSPRRRTALRVSGAILAVVLAMGIPTWDGYLFYRTGNPAYQVHTVAAGGAGTLMNVSWKVRVEQADSLPGARPIKAEQEWLKITVTRTSLNAEGVLRRGEPTIKVKHPDGRTWQAQIVNTGLPVEVKDHKIGTGYDYDVISLVPKKIAGEVEVEVLPSTIRVPLEEESVEDLFKRVGTEKTEPQDQVLLFRR